MKLGYRVFRAAPMALNILTDLAENAESESVRLGATRDLLDRAGLGQLIDMKLSKRNLWKNSMLSS